MKLLLLRSPVFQQHEQHKPHESYKFVRAKPFCHQNTKTPNFTKHTNLQLLLSSVFGLRSSNNINHMNPINSFGLNLFATKTQKHQISPNIQIVNSSVFGLRSPVFQQHKPHESYKFVRPKPFCHQNTKTPNFTKHTNRHPPSSVFGLRSSNNMNNINHMNL